MTGVSPIHIPAPWYFISAHSYIKNGGNNRARTYDPLLVRQMLSQLSYASIPAVFSTAEVIISQDYLIVNSFFTKNLNFLLILKHFFNIFSCEDMFLVTEATIYFQMLILALCNLFGKHFMKLWFSE